MHPVSARPSDLWPKLDLEIQAAIKAGEMEGANLLVGRGDEILYRKSFGYADRKLDDVMTAEHVFDAASLTKPLATATAVLLLADRGLIDLDAPISQYLQFPGSGAASAPSLTELLTHTSGLPATIATDKVGSSLLDVEVDAERRGKFLYSDVGYLWLGRMVESVSKQSLSEFFEQHIARPLHMKGASFRPEDPPLVPTFGVPLGVVHDPRARELGGVAGHAGLFLTDLDVHRWLVGLSGPSSILSSEGRERLFLTRIQGRSLGLDADTRFSSPRGSRFSPRTSAGHTGFTGPSFWFDTESGLHVILMASRLHPDNQGSTVELRRRLGTLVAEHQLGRGVKTGLDVLSGNQFARLRGKRLGFVVNPTSRDRFGRHLTEMLLERNDLNVVSLFTPEHGLLGLKDEPIANGYHDGLKVPIYSLYGETRSPKKEWLEKLDVLVFDLQDVGVRYYTYISTLKNCLQVAAQTGTTILVLDRPNPLGGVVVDGHIAQEFSFIACDELPLVHGMTMAEVAAFLNRDLRAKLEVELMEGWKREMLWADTGLPFFSPSPNLAEMEAVHLYPVLGQLEWMKLSVGRGTKFPFRVIGAPSIKDPAALAQSLNDARLDGLTFIPRFFVPRSSKFSGQLCGGVEVKSTRALKQPAELGLRLAEVLTDWNSQEFRRADMGRHLGTSKVDELWRRPMPRRAWLSRRKDFLSY